MRWNILVSLVLMGCSADDERPPSKTPEGAEQVPEQPDGGLQWEACGAGTCTWVEVPVDWSDPEGDTLELRVARIRSDATNARPLFLNFGGFGAPGAQMLQGGGGEDRNLTQTFDLVSWDPRGSGESSPLTCQNGPGGLDSVLDLAVDVQTEADILEIQSTIADLIDKCRDEHGPLVDQMSFSTHAADLDAIREAMELDDFDFLGYSAGTALGMTYADQYPDGVQRMVLDSVMGPLGGMSTQTVFQLDGSKQAVDNWDAWCRAQTTDKDCKVRGDPKGAPPPMLRSAGSSTPPSTTIPGRSWRPRTSTSSGRGIASSTRSTPSIS